MHPALPRQPNSEPTEEPFVFHKNFSYMIHQPFLFLLLQYIIFHLKDSFM